MARPKKARPTSVEIYEGADGSWHGYLTVGVKPDGRPDRRHRMGKDRETVERKIRDLEDLYLRDEVLAPGRSPTLEQYLADWLVSIKPHVSPSTWANTYEYASRVYIVPGLGAHRLSSLETKHIDAFYARLIGDDETPGLTSPGNAALIHRALRTALNDAVRQDRIKTNPVLAARAPESDAEEIRPLDRDEQQRLLATMAGRRTGARWLVAMLGLRQGEVLALRWSDIGFGSGIVTVQGKAQRRAWRHGCADPARCARWRHGCSPAARCGRDAWRCPRREVRCREKPCPPAWQHGCTDRAACKAKLAYACRKRQPAHCPDHRGECPGPCPSGCTGHAATCPQRVGGGVQIEEDEQQRGRKVTRRRLKTKTKAGTRRVGFPREILDELLEHRERQAAEREHAGDMWHEHDLVFTTVVGMPVDAKRDWEDWKALLAEAGVRDVRPHDARHTAATMLLAKGVDRRVVMDIMGWSSERMLQRYQHVVDEMRAEAAGRIGDALFRPEGGSATDHATDAATNVIDFAARRRNRRPAG